MPDILSLIYHGRYHPQERMVYVSREYLMQSERAEELADALSRALPDGLREQLQEYIRLNAEVNALEGEVSFHEGFCMGAQLMSAAFEERDE